MTKCPCEECICVPICKHRTYNVLLDKCNLLRKQLFYKGRHHDTKRRRWFSKAILCTERCLKPKLWHVEVENDGYARVTRRWQNEVSM